MYISPYLALLLLFVLFLALCILFVVILPFLAIWYESRRTRKQSERLGDSE
jgi:hypothetical protein